MSLLSTSLMPGSDSAWSERFAAWCQKGEQLSSEAEVTRRNFEVAAGARADASKAAGGAFRGQPPLKPAQLYALLQSMNKAAAGPTSLAFSSRHCWSTLSPHQHSQWLKETTQPDQAGRPPHPAICKARRACDKSQSARGPCLSATANPHWRLIKSCLRLIDGVSKHQITALAYKLRFRLSQNIAALRGESKQI